MLFQQTAYGHQCFSYLLSQDSKLYGRLQNRLRSLTNKDLQVLETLAYMHYGYSNLDEFLHRGFLDFQFYDMPNGKPGYNQKADKFYREGLHYKLMMHFKYYTQTIIYNSKTYEIISGSTRDNF